MIAIWSRRSERGSAAVELTVVIPALIFMLGLMMAGGRVWFARATVAEAAQTAARAASLERTAGAATSEGQSAARHSLSTAGLDCSGALVQIDTSGFGVEVGAPAAVSARVTCVVTFADLTLPRVPGSIRLTAEQVSALDTYRSR